MINDIYNRWLTMEEICNYLGVSRDTAVKWMKKSNMPAHRVGRLWKFRASEIDEWIQSGGAALK